MSQNPKSNIPEGIWKLENYGTNNETGWSKIKADKRKNIYLIFKHMNLMLVHNGGLIESVSLLNDDVRMASKDESLGIAVIRDGIRMRKIRLKFAGVGLYPGSVNAKNCVNVLKKYVKIEPAIHNSNDDSMGNGEPISISLTQYVSELLKKNTFEFYSDHEHLCSIYPLEDIIQACILDVDFPSFVAQVNDMMPKKV